MRGQVRNLAATAAEMRDIAAPSENAGMSENRMGADPERHRNRVGSAHQTPRRQKRRVSSGAPRL
jgi:hypothetical protein